MESKWRLFQKSFALEKKRCWYFHILYISFSVRRKIFDEILPGINYPHWFQSAVCWQFSHLNLLLFLHRHFRRNIWEKLIILWNIAETSMKFPEKWKPSVILRVSSRFSEENYAQICQDKSAISSHFDLKIFLSNTSKAKLFTLIVTSFVFVYQKLSFVSCILIRYFRREKFHDLSSEQIKTLLGSSPSQIFLLGKDPSNPSCHP